MKTADVFKPAYTISMKEDDVLGILTTTADLENCSEYSCKKGKKNMIILLP